jgi:hypothetical protein
MMPGISATTKATNTWVSDIDIVRFSPGFRVYISTIWGKLALL